MKKLIAFILLSVFLLLCGCSMTDTAVDEKEDKRFIVEYVQQDTLPNMKIIRDTHTGIAYLYVQGINSGGLTELVEVRK